MLGEYLSISERPDATAWRVCNPTAFALMESGMFVFFSSRLGCLGSIAVSVVLTLLLLLLLGVF